MTVAKYKFSLINLIHRAKNIEFLTVHIPVGTSLVPPLLLTKVIQVDSTSSRNHNE